MKRTMQRVLALCMAMVMLLMFASCGEQPAPAPTPDAGAANSSETSVVETGTEEELTAVRDALIKDSEIKGLGDITKMELYENGGRVTHDKLVQAKDNKKIYYSGDIKRVVNYTDGYVLDIPQDWKPDYSMSSLRVRYDTDEVSLIASREDDAISYHGTTEKYMDALYLFIKDPNYQKNNNITVVKDVETFTVDEDWTMEVYRLKIEGTEEGTKCYYTYVDYYNDLRQTYHMMFKSVDDRDFSAVYNTFRDIGEKGAPVDTRLYPESANPNWSEETKAHYEALLQQDHIDWGLFAYKLQTTGWDVTIPLLEKRMDYTFPVVSEYIHYGSKQTVNSEIDVGEFPLDFANEVTADGTRMMQITYQYTLNNNMDMTFQNPMLDIYRGTEESKQIMTQFAEGAAQYGKPFYFRLNNEMNTDWTSYCAMANMLDPDIYIDTWIRLYDIFTETGANQYAIWIFNGFDNSYPPYNWCDYQCYFPSAKYVDMLGLTGYNSGDPANGAWKSFETIYDKIYDNYNPHFSDWAWIISEFGCADREGASKAEWITEMFNVLETGKYPALKVAIWFNCSDYMDGVVTNDFNLEKDKEVYTAFGEGLKKSRSTK